jgi:hypothetical protein
VPAGDFVRLRTGPVLCSLDEHAVLEFEGPDAVSFLQAQTTADAGAMTPQSWQLGGYCTPKGRLLAIFHCWLHESGARWLLPASIAGAIQRRLSMYVLRSKVRVRDVTAQWRVWAALGSDAPQALRAASLAVPAQPWQARELAPWAREARVAALPAGAGCGARLLCVVPQADEARFLGSLPALPRCGAPLWWWSQIDAAIPDVVAATSELFVPQTLNLEVLGAVSFRKGCYPGQEIVARSQYLGKLRRRMAPAHAAQIGPGGDVFAGDQPVGRIVLAASAPEGGWDLLFECSGEAGSGALPRSELRAGSAGAAVLQMRPLPYPIFDPTA